MSPANSPSLTSAVTEETAVKPPKRMVTSVSCSKEVLMCAASDVHPDGTGPVGA